MSNTETTDAILIKLQADILKAGNDPVHNASLMATQALQSFVNTVVYAREKKISI